MSPATYHYPKTCGAFHSWSPGDKLDRAYVVRDVVKIESGFRLILFCFFLG